MLRTGRYGEAIGDRILKLLADGRARSLGELRLLVGSSIPPEVVESRLQSESKRLPTRSFESLRCRAESQILNTIIRRMVKAGVLERFRLDGRYEYRRATLKEEASCSG